MPKKVKVAAKEKKQKIGNSFKEILQQNQIVSELLKIVSARAEDANKINALIESFKDPQKLDLQVTKTALVESESRELSRLHEEDSLLSQLKSSKLEASFHKKKFETTVKKMMLINSKFEEKPSESLLSATEIHLHKIMKSKIFEESSKQPASKKLAGSDVTESIWYENFSKSMRILDCMLIGEVIDIYSPVLYCIKSNRTIFEQSYKKVHCLMRSVEDSSPSQLKDEGINSDLISVISANEADLNLFNMFEGFNQKIQKAIKSYISKCSQTDWITLPKTPRPRNYTEKSIRNTNYKSRSPINPNSARKTPKKPGTLFDLQNPYFKPPSTLPEIILITHSCIVIQRFIKYRKFKKFVNKSLVIQKWVRGFLARKKLFWLKTEKFRKTFACARIKHWLSLLANKVRERRSAVQPRDYNKHLKQIITIQKLAKSFLVRKKVTQWKRVFHSLKSKKAEKTLYLEKQKLWRCSFSNEDSALLNTKTAEEDLNSFVVQLEAKGKKPSNAAVEELVKGYLKNDSEMRSSYFGKARQDRLKVFEDNF